MFWGVCNIAYLYYQYAFDAAERYLQWYTLLNLRAWHVKVKWKWKWKSLSCVWLFVTPLTIQSMEYSRPEYWSGQPFPFAGDQPNPGIKPKSSALQADSLPVEPQGKSKNAGAGSLSLIQWIFPTQESNQCLLHCRQILYQLRYQGSPHSTKRLNIICLSNYYLNFSFSRT